MFSSHERALEIRPVCIAVAGSAPIYDAKVFCSWHERSKDRGLFIYKINLQHTAATETFFSKCKMAIFILLEHSG